MNNDAIMNKLETKTGENDQADEKLEEKEEHKCNN